MRIVQLTPGIAGSFYCGNCLRDVAMAQALRKAGHDAILVPLYLPVLAEAAEPAPDAPVFFGGINVFLQQKSALFRRTPRWVDRIFDSPALLGWAARRAGMTDAKDLAETTLSMLRGEHGHQAKELERLVAWLASEGAPDLVCLSNALLIGMAKRIKAELRVPVACMLQDEDIFLDGLPEPYRQQAWQAISERASDADAFIAVSRYFASVMCERLGLPPERIRVVYNGIPLDGYEPAASPPEPPALGFLERLCPEKGLDTLVEAFVLLRSRDGLGRLKLRAAGGWTPADEPFLDALRQRVAHCGLAGEVELLPNLHRADRQAFLRSLSALAAPTRHGEAFGMCVLEALASGVPVVLPRHGAFPELLDATGGGLLYEPEDSASLAAALETMLSDPPRARELGQRGREAVLERFGIDRAATEMARIYEAVGGTSASRV